MRMITPARHIFRVQRWLRLATLGALLALTLAACGTTKGSGSVPGAPATATSTSTAGKLPRPCPGTYTTGQTPALTLSNQGSMTGDAHIGAIVAIVLDGGHIWNLGNVSGGALVAQNQAGLYDQATQNCIWLFKATAPGLALVNFVGRANCAPDVACPAYALLAKFTIRVS